MEEVLSISIMSRIQGSGVTYIILSMRTNYICTLVHTLPYIIKSYYKNLHAAGLFFLVNVNFTLENIDNWYLIGI